jgi:hypothetical protein
MAEGIRLLGKHVAVEVVFEHECDFSLGLGLQQSLRRHERVGGHVHVGEQHAEIGLVDAQLALHRG